MLCDSHHGGLVAELEAAWDELERAKEAMLQAKSSYKDVRVRLVPKRNRLEHDRTELLQRIRDAEARIDEATAARKPGDIQRHHIRVVQLRSQRSDLMPELSRARDEISQAYRRWRERITRYRERKDALEGCKLIFVIHIEPVLADQLPEDYRNKFKLVVHRDRVDIYFGGEGKPDGLHHAHYIANHDGILTWKRELGEKRGRYLA